MGSYATSRIVAKSQKRKKLLELEGSSLDRSNLEFEIRKTAGGKSSRAAIILEKWNHQKRRKL